MDQSLLGLEAFVAQQVSGALARMETPQRISHETIYSVIYAMPKGELRQQVIGLLSRHRKGRRPRTAGKDRRSMIIGVTSIDERESTSKKSFELSEIT